MVGSAGCDRRVWWSSGVCVGGNILCVRIIQAAFSA